MDSSVLLIRFIRDKHTLLNSSVFDLTLALSLSLFKHFSSLLLFHQFVGDSFPIHRRKLSASSIGGYFSVRVQKKRKTGIRMASSSKTQVVETKEELGYSSSEGEDESEIERELAEVTFEDLLKARSNGSHAVYRKPTQENKTARANKNRPMETSCKKPVSRFREVVQVPKKMVRDPRFESLCGELNVEGFRKRYNFLYENDLPAEKEELKKQLKKSKDPGVIDHLKNRISWIDRQLKFDSTKSTGAAILGEHKKKEREAAKQGKQPFYLKKSEIRKQRLFEKFNKLKESGKLDSFIEKRRKKNASKDRRFMPYRRPDNSRQGS